MRPIDFVNLQLKIDKKAAELENLKDELALAEAELLEKMAEDGLTHFKTARGNGRVDRKIWASCDGDVQGVIKAMEKDGLTDLVSETVNGNTLSGFVREYDPNKCLSPEALVKELRKAGFKHTAKAIKISEKIQIVVSGKR